MFKNILQLASGTFIAQAILLLTTPFLARMYTPADFGVFVIMLALLSIISPFSTLRYETAILIKEKNYEVFSLVLLTMLIIIFSSLILFFSLPHILNLMPNASDGFDVQYRYIATLIFMTTGAIEVLTIWHLRQKRYKIISFGKVIQSIVVISFQIGLYKKFEGMGLVYGYTIGLGITLFYYSLSLFKNDLHNLRFKESLQAMKVAAIEHKNFPLFSTWSSLLNALGNQLPILLIGNVAGVGVSGVYDMARKYTRAPLNLIGQSTFRVVSQRIGILAGKREDAAIILSSVITKMMNYSILPFIIAVISFEYLFIFLLGEQWKDSGIYAQIISPWLFVTFLSWPLTSAYNTFGYQKALIAFNFLFVFSILLSFICMYLLSLNTFQTIAVLSFFGSVTRIIYCYWILSKCEVVITNKVITTLTLYTLTIMSVAYISISLQTGRS